MTTYRAIASTETDPEAPITSTLMKALQQNVLAITEADASAPSTLFPSVLLGTINTTSGSTQTLSSLVLTPYRFILAVVDGISLALSTSTLSFAGCAFFTSASNTERPRGLIWVDLSGGIGASIVGNITSAAPSSSVTPTVAVLRSSLSTATTSISVSTSASTFSGGTVKIYGVK